MPWYLTGYEAKAHIGATGAVTIAGRLAIEAGKIASIALHESAY